MGYYTTFYMKYMYTVLIPLSRFFTIHCIHVVVHVGGIKWSLQAFESMRAQHLSLRARALIKVTFCSLASNKYFAKKNYLKPSMRALVKVCNAWANEHALKCCEQFEQKPNFASTWKFWRTIHDPSCRHVHNVHYN